MIWFIIISISISITNVYTLVSIGANLDNVRDWSRSLSYVNLVRQARVWGSADKPWDGNATFDRISGWPNNDFGMVLAADHVDLDGTYLLYAKGNAQVSTAGGSPANINNKTYDASTNTLTAIINVPQGTTQMMLSFRNTTGPGLKDIVILQPGYTLSSKSKFTNLILAHLSRFNMLRFMDWTHTNDNPEVNWNDTTSINWPQYTAPKRNPWITIPFIVNEINKPIDIWINIPHGATDNYIYHIAQVMLKELNPISKIYVEYSNEVWNSLFTQEQANRLAAVDSVQKHGDPLRLNYDNISNSNTWGYRRTAYQIKRISDLFQSVFGKENVGLGKRIRPILAGQAVNPYIIMTGLDYLNTIHGPPSKFLHGIAVAPYFDLEHYKTWSNLTVDQVLDGLNSSIQRFLPEQGWSQQAPLGVHAVYAAWYKLNVYGYEGGPDTAAGCGECSLEAKIKATRHPRMTDICLRYLNGWSRFGFQTLNWFGAGASKITKYGSWTLLEDMRQETLIDTTKMFNSTSPVAQLPRPSPKLKAIDQFRQSSVQLKFGIPIPSYNVNATHFAGYRTPSSYLDLRYFGSNSTFYYPLQILQSPIQIHLTVYVSGNSGILEASINNEQFVQVQTPKTFNMATFQAAPLIQFNITQTITPSIVTLRLKNIQTDYAIHSFHVVSSKI
ncbi:unnamed protein product [Rotaria sp. Silwood1]|nr:unnamed protein product [Rotaria sp. Silwood1]CAF3773769.1 unnamed protein product [Rotaria sp. Silwood1]CAF4831299.1 unnamed protein product [Rotaria sp. Silwood1]